MMTKRVFLLMALIGVPAAHADEYVNSADANGDGFVSLYELRAAYFADPEFNKRIEQSFADYDRNGDGLISADERRAVSPDIGQAATTSRSENTSEEKTTDRSADFSNSGSKMAGTGDVSPAGKASYATDTTSKPDAKEPDILVRAPAGAAIAASVEKQPATKNTGNYSRSELWIMEIDADKSGGASIAELVASGGGEKWFTDRDFAAADKNNDGDLNATELDALITGIERRHR